MTKVSKEPYKVQEFTNWANGELKNIFGNKGFSVNTLRHSFCTYLSNFRRLTLEDRKKYAAKMGHSFITGLEYVKYNDET